MNPNMACFNLSWYMPIIRLVTIQIDFIIYMTLAILPVIYQVYLLHYYVIKFVSGFGQVGGFSVYTNSIDFHDISEILLKVALNIIILAPLSSIVHYIWGIYFDCSVSTFFRLDFRNCKTSKCNNGLLKWLFWCRNIN